MESKLVFSGFPSRACFSLLGTLFVTVATLPTTFTLGYAASLLSDGIRDNKLSFLAGICFRDRANPLVCICIKQEGNGIESHSFIRLNPFAYK